MESEAEGPALPRACPSRVSRLPPVVSPAKAGAEGRGKDGKGEGPSFIFKDLALIQLAALVVLCDQATKFLVREYLQLGQSVPVEGFFRITHTYNTGSAFGLFQGQNTPLIVVAIVGIFILGMIYRTQRPPSNLLRLSLGLQIGGAIGNLTDRLLFGHVTDFLDVGAWPIFNLADSSIVVGLVLLAWVFLRPGRRQTESTVESLDGPSPTGTAQPSDTRLERYEEYRRWMRLDR